MGQMKFALLTALLGGALLTSCKKDKHNDLLSNNNGNYNGTSAAANSSGTGGGTDMQYRITASATDTNNLLSLFTWTAGYIRVAELHFDANMLNDTGKNSNHGNGNGNNSGHGNNGNGPVTHVHYSSTTPQQVDLFSLAALAGSVTIPYGTYDNIILHLKIAPDGNVHALYLEGAVTINNDTIPVYVMVDESLDLLVKWMQKVTISANNTWPNINMSLGQLTAGVDLTMLQQLTLTNGTIVISSSSNTAIYHLLLTNMQSMLHVKP